MIQLGTAAKTSGWYQSNPIPTDPCYESYSQRQKTTSYKLKSPIPVDNHGNSTSRSSRSASPKPRVKPEALDIARNNQGRELAYLFNPSMKIIPIGARLNTREVVNHGKENYRKIKEIQRANKEKQMETSRQTPMKAVYKPDKFDHVRSKVAQQIKTPGAPRPSTADGSGRMYRSSSLGNLNITGKAVDERAKKVVNNEKSVVKQNTKDQRRRPASVREQRRSIATDEEKAAKTKTRPSTAYSSKQRPKSHIQLNKEAIRNSTLKRSPSLSAIDDLKKKKEKDLEEHKRGTVPKYLKNRQLEWRKAEEERIANIPDPTIPEGHSLMAEEERERTLIMLKSSHVEMMSELKALPLSRDTLRIKHRKDELEKKLREVDSAIKIFSRPRVFIKNNE